MYPCKGKNRAVVNRKKDPPSYQHDSSNPQILQGIFFVDFCERLRYNTCMENNIQGHIFNIGTTLENTDDQSDYAISKRKLRISQNFKEFHGTS